MCVQNKWWKKGIALVLAGLLCAVGCSGCGETAPSEFPTVKEPVIVQQSGELTELTVGVLELPAERREALEEIAEKYMADDPNVTFEFVSFDGDSEALQSAAAAGEVQIAEVTKSTQAQWVAENLLVDLREELIEWDEFSTLNTPAKAVVDSMGQGHAYVMPSNLQQLLLVYRKDWVAEYNADKEWQDTVNFETWTNVTAALQAITESGHPGTLLEAQVGGEESHLAETLLWSDLSTSALLDLGAGYYSSSSVLDEEGIVSEIMTIFEGEAATVSVQNYLQLFPLTQITDTAQAVERFCAGETAAVLVDRDGLQALQQRAKDTLPEETVGVTGLPQGRSGSAVAEPTDFTGWGVVVTEHTAAALNFVLYLSNADNNTHYALQCGALPIHTTAEDLEGALTEGVLATEMEMISQSGTYRYAGGAAMFEDLQAQLHQEVLALTAGTQDVEAFLQACDALCKITWEQQGQKFGVKPE